MGRWGDGEMAKIFIALIILMRYRRYSQLSYPYSLLPTPLMECGEMKVMCSNLICVHVCPLEVNVFC
ncbi:hypothetical protein [Moorena producens]|nr:hypothetical protein [Moorena producens]